MRGFTLIELLLVIAIVSIIAILSTPFYARFLLQNSVDNTTDQLASSIRKAQTYAMAGKRGSTWSVNYSQDTITLYKGSDFLSRDSSFDEKFSINPSVNISGITDVTFSRVNGLPTPSALSITISSGSNSKTITVNSQGVVNK